MKTAPTIGQEVVRSKGDYVVGRKGPVVEIDEVNGRARVAWNEGGGRTWVKFDVIEPTSIPYEITPVTYKWHPKRGQVSTGGDYRRI